MPMTNDLYLQVIHNTTHHRFEGYLSWMINFEVKYIVVIMVVTFIEVENEPGSDLSKEIFKKKIKIINT